MRVLNLEVHNVQRISDVRFDLDGRNLFLVGGKNAQGKTSALIALLMALSGRSGMDNYPEIALKDGEDEGWVKIDLSGEQEETHQPAGIRVELKLTRHARKGVVVEEFQILDSDGDAAPAPRELLKRLFVLKAFDPLEFQRMKPKDQKALLEKLLGLDFTADREEYKRLFDKRTDVNRNFKAAKAQLDGMPTHPDVQEVSATDLMTELDRRQSINNENAEQRRSVDRAKESVDRCRESESQTRQKIEYMRQQLAEAESALVSKALTTQHAESHLSEVTAAVALLVDMNTDEIRTQIKEADSTNAKARANAKRKEQFTAWQNLGKVADDLTEKMEKIEKANKKKLEDAEFPVDGMSLDADGVLLNGLPFGQASLKERIFASVDVGIALNPTLRLMVSQDGGALDAEAITALDEKLAESDFQMIVEIATRSESDEDLCAVVIKDGKVSKTNPVKPPVKAKGSLLAEASA